MPKNKDSESPGPVLVYDRHTGALVQERVLGDRFLRLAYRPRILPLTEFFLFRHALITRILGWYCNTRLSRHKIARTIQTLEIDPADFRDPVANFRTFNDFFCRHLREGARPFDPAVNVVCSPADARMLAFPKLDGDTCFPIKGAPFTLNDLLHSRNDEAETLAGGSLIIARLCPADYHRFHFPTAGRTVSRRDISGAVHSVNPIALQLGMTIFTENRRVVSILNLRNIGHAAFVEVGAFGVAGIVQTHDQAEFSKMDEKGYFRFGGSTVVVAFPPGRVTLAHDLCRNTAAGYETRILAGEEIGRIDTVTQNAG